jgi:hypothetical protein
MSRVGSRRPSLGDTTVEAAVKRAESPAGTSRLLQSASVGLLKKAEDPVQAVLNMAKGGSRLGSKESSIGDARDKGEGSVFDKGGLRKRLGIDPLAVTTEPVVASEAGDASPIMSPGPSPGGSRTVRRQRRGAGADGEKLAVQPRIQQRRWSINIVEKEKDDMDAILSPVWQKSNIRKRTCRLTMDGDNRSGDAAAGEDEGSMSDDEKKTKEFLDMQLRLRHLVGQTCVRMTDMLQIIGDKLKKDADFFDKSESNKERLVNIAYLENIANYRLSKWLHQLEPRKVAAPSKPTKPELGDARSADLLSEVKFALTRMEMLASTLAPLLQKIVNDAKNQRPYVDGAPVSPTLRHPVGLAERRGIVDVQELVGIHTHLEKLLETMESLTYNPAPAQKVAVAIKTIIAVGRFKKGGSKSLRANTVEGTASTTAAANRDSVVGAIAPADGTASVGSVPSASASAAASLFSKAAAAKPAEPAAAETTSAQKDPDATPAAAAATDTA